MQWGSRWETTQYQDVNVFWTYTVQEEVEPVKRNKGGRQFRGVNPFLRVRSSQQIQEEQEEELRLPSPTITRELIYATEAFDRRQQAISPDADSRWPGERQKHTRVPVLDVALVVAFQKLLRDEELEFLLLLLAMECD